MDSLHWRSWQQVEDRSLRLTSASFSGLDSGVSLQEQKQLTYFIRQENTEITEENFHEVVQFGTVRRPYVDSLVRMLNAIYLPRLFRKASWPESIKNEFFSEIYHFMTSLTGRVLPFFPSDPPPRKGCQYRSR